MRRCVKMTKEEIIEAMVNAAEYEGRCDKCIIPNAETCNSIEASTCVLAIAQYLTQDIEQIPRCHKCKTVQDFIKMEHEWTETEYSNLAEFAMEKVEK